MFGAQPGKGSSGIPDFLAILTGGSALVYTLNKAAAANGPSITDVQPPTARMGDTVTVTGTNLLPPAADNAKPKVTVGGVAVPDASVTLPGFPDTIAIVVPAPATGAWPQNAQQVAVTTAAGGIATKGAALTVVADSPLISHVDPSRVKRGEKMTIYGRFLLAPGTKPGITAASGTETVGGLIGGICDDATQSLRWPLTFTGPTPMMRFRCRSGSRRVESRWRQSTPRQR